MSNRFLCIARVIDDGFDDQSNYFLSFEVDVKPAGMATAHVASPVQDWFYTVEVPEDLVDQPEDKKDLYKYVQDDLYAALVAEFGASRFASTFDKTDILLQGVAGKGEKGESNGPLWENVWEEGFPYKLNDVVIHDDRIWICTGTMELLEHDPGPIAQDWPADSPLRTASPRLLADVPPSYQYARPRHATELGVPDATLTSGPLNPGRRWDLYVDGPPVWKGAWNANTRYERGNVVFMARKRKKGKNNRNDPDNEDASQTLQFIALKPNRGVDPVDDRIENPNLVDGSWEVFVDFQESSLVNEWGRDKAGAPLVSGWTYFPGDIVTWANATYQCMLEHEWSPDDVYVSESDPGMEPDDPDNNGGRWQLLVQAVPNIVGEWKSSGGKQRYQVGDVVWVDKKKVDDAKDKQLQFICSRVHKPTANNKPTAAKVDPALETYDVDLPWKVYFDGEGIVSTTFSPDGTAVVELVTKDPFVKPKRIPKTAGSDYVLNDAKALVPFDATKTASLDLQVDFYNPDYDAANNGLKVEWWLYAYETMKSDLNKAGTPIWSAKLTGADKAATYSQGTLSLSIVPAVDPTAANYALGHSGGEVRKTTAFALAIRRTAASGKVEPSHAGKISYAAITVTPIEEEA